MSLPAESQSCQVGCLRKLGSKGQKFVSIFCGLRPQIILIYVMPRRSKQYKLTCSCYYHSREKIAAAENIGFTIPPYPSISDQSTSARVSLVNGRNHVNSGFQNFKCCPFIFCSFLCCGCTRPLTVYKPDTLKTLS